jgi:hypothetical protein
VANAVGNPGEVCPEEDCGHTLQAVPLKCKTGHVRMGVCPEHGLKLIEEPKLELFTEGQGQ